MKMSDFTEGVRKLIVFVYPMGRPIKNMKNGIGFQLLVSCLTNEAPSKQASKQTHKKQFGGPMSFSER
jgi:hypothetical protein